MKVVLVSAAGPPLSGSHATRVTAFIKALAAAKISTSYVTCHWPDSMKDRSDLYKQISPLCEILEGSGGIVRSAVAATSRVGKMPRIYRVFRRVRAFLKGFALPDTFVTWIPSAVRLSNSAVLNSTPAVIISSGAPFSAHVASAITAVRTGALLILDYGDPWVYEPQFPRGSARFFVEEKLERFVLSRAVAICFTTSETAQLYTTTYPDLASKVVVVPMGYDPNEFARAALQRPEPGTGPLRIIYAGRLTEEYRSLGGFRSLVQSISDAVKGGRDVQFVFYGLQQTRLETELADLIRGGKVIIGGNLEHADFVQALVDADGLLVFGNKSYLQIPGKVAQCIAARRPILYLPNVDDLARDPTLNLLKKTIEEGQFTFTSSRDITDFLAFVVSGRPVRLQEQQAARLTWESISGTLLDVIEAAAAPIVGVR